MSSRSGVLAGLFAVCALLPEVAGATEIRLLSANVFTGVLDGPIKDFERTSGHSVVIVYATAGNIKGRVQSGEPGDVTIVTRPMMDELESCGHYEGQDEVSSAGRVRCGTRCKGRR
jgi:molybdate transport system substrate-binding protein